MERRSTFAAPLSARLSVHARRWLSRRTSLEAAVDKNVANAGVISPEAGRVCVCVIHTDEEWMIANTVIRILGLTREREDDYENKNNV